MAARPWPDSWSHDDPEKTVTLLLRAVAIAALLAGVAAPGASFAAAQPYPGAGAATLMPGDFVVDDEGPTCPPGGPIFHVGGGGASVLAEGSPLQKPRGSVFNAQGDLIVADGRGGLLEVDPGTGTATPIAARAPFSPRDVAIDAAGDYVVVDWPDPGQYPDESPALYSVTPHGAVSEIALGAPLSGPHGLDLDDSGNAVVADSLAGVVRVTPGGAMTLVYASGPGTGLNRASDLRVDAAGDYIIADLDQALTKVTPAGVLSDVHRGPPFSSYDPQTRIGGPRGVVIESSGDYVLVDERSRALLRVTPTGAITEVFSGDPLCLPADLTVVPETFFADGFESGDDAAWSGSAF